MFSFLDEISGSAEYAKNETLALEELSIQIIRSKRKSVSLQVKPQGLIMRAPLNCPTKELRRFAMTKLNWLRERQQNMQKQLDGAEKHYRQGETFLYQGQHYQLNITKGSKGVAHFNHIEHTISIVIPNNVKNQTDYIRRKLIGAYKQDALDYLKLRCRELSRITALMHKSIKVRDYKARWGSCSHTGELSFNWRIIMAPKEAIDCVIIHELAHTKYFNHSKRFWALVYQHCPDYAERHAYFKENQFRLMF